MDSNQRDTYVQMLGLDGEVRSDELVGEGHGDVRVQLACSPLLVCVCACVCACHGNVCACECVCACACCVWGRVDVCASECVLERLGASVHVHEHSSMCGYICV